ncbi:MAG: ATP-binding cassette domain-containing protein [Spirochaetaceae bacterium]|jgi:simple sugar transport system ATP-binding protein|nr:ATP-binding cassette domain-containing protein [Spirochaetaceae bacterium]
MVELKGIRKYFYSNGVSALDGADFNLREEEIHALLGENGAGKSILMHIMAGFTKPGAPGSEPGLILVNGKEQRFTSPARALAAGIGMVCQHPHHIPGFSVWENCIVGSKERPPFWLNRRRCHEQIRELNSRFRFDLPIDSPAETLTVSQGQKAAILTMLLRNVQYLIFDEPTAVLTPAETQNLFELFETLRDQGKGIVLISHKLEETLKIADRVTVLRQGKTRMCCSPGDLSNDEFYNCIFTDDSIASTALTTGISGTASVTQQVHFTPSTTTKGGKQDVPVLSLRNFTVTVPGRPLIRGINLELKRGVVMGIAGVRDSGLETLELALTGFLPSSGTLRINGTELYRTARKTAQRVRSFRSAGGSYLGTRNEGVMLPIRDLLLIHSHRRFHDSGFLERSKINLWIGSIMAAAELPCKANGQGSALSGGQLQRLLLTRETAEQGDLLVLSDPGRNLDRQYREKIAALLREKAAEGKSALIFSTDVEELLAFADSVAVLRDGVFSRVIDLNGSDGRRKDQVQETIREAMVGTA